MSYYERNLPHWHPEGKSLLVTWRLHGFSPAGIQPRPKDMDSGKVFVAVDREIDRGASGPLWLKDPRIAPCVVDTLHFGEKELKLYELNAYVVMANHVHVLLCPKVSLAKITQAIKTFTARKANEILGRTGQKSWAEESYDHWVRDEKDFQKIIAYIERNPVSAGLVEKIEEWPYSSAAWTGKDACPY